jgi:hypothetical protein
MVSRVFRGPHPLRFTTFERSIPADAPMVRRLRNSTQTDIAGQPRTEPHSSLSKGSGWLATMVVYADATVRGWANVAPPKHYNASTGLRPIGLNVPQAAR